MAKKGVGKIKLQNEAGKANPSPPVGPALGQHGVNGYLSLADYPSIVNCVASNFTAKN